MNAVRKALNLSDKFEQAWASFVDANPDTQIVVNLALAAFNAGARGYENDWPYPLGPASDVLWFRQRGHVAASEADTK